MFADRGELDYKLYTVALSIEGPLNTKWGPRLRFARRILEIAPGQDIVKLPSRMRVVEHHRKRKAADDFHRIIYWLVENLKTGRIQVPELPVAAGGIVAATYKPVVPVALG